MIFKKKESLKPKQADLLLNLNKKTSFTESIKSIRTNLAFSEVDKKMQVILITSAQPGDGKSFISANLAKQTGFSEEDLQLFFDALRNMFDVDRSAARGLMSAQKLIVFKHDSVLGNAPANKLFDLVKIEKKNKDAVPRSFNDYKVTIDLDSVPSGVSVEELI